MPETTARPGLLTRPQQLARRIRATLRMWLGISALEHRADEAEEVAAGLRRDVDALAGALVETLKIVKRQSDLHDTESLRILDLTERLTYYEQHSAVLSDLRRRMGRERKARESALQASAKQPAPADPIVIDEASELSDEAMAAAVAG